MSNSYDTKLRVFAKKIGYQHEGSVMLKEALTHRTFAHESKEQLIDNQRLEFSVKFVLKLSFRQTRPDQTIPESQQSFMIQG